MSRYDLSEDLDYSLWVYIDRAANIFGVWERFQRMFPWENKLVRADLEYEQRFA